MKKRTKMKKIVAGILLALTFWGTVIVPMKEELAIVQAEEKNEEKNTNKKSMVSAENATFNGYDVVFCIDNSRSVWNQQSIRNEALRAISHLATGSDIRIGGVYFANSVYKSMNLTSVENKEGSDAVKEFLTLVEKDPGNIDTNMGKAIQEAKKLFENQDASRKKILILFSDGINENLAGDLAYKQAADALTQQEVTSMREKDIPIYCVYLQKSRNDEAYLRKVVNYFDNNFTYDQTRFKKITESEINRLSDEFTKIFYDFQNNMKYRQISVDSSGKMNFFVPMLGINKIQLHLYNDEAYKVELNHCKDKNISMKSWSDGGNIYITVEKPEIGEYNLAVKGNGNQNTVGTIAYYTDLYAKGEIIHQEEKDKEVYKNSEQVLRVKFYNSDGVEYEANSTMKVTATVLFQKEDGTQSEKELVLNASENGYISDKFAFDDYGVYQIKTRIVYEDFIDLTYSVLEGTVENAGLIVRHINEKFIAEKKDGKLVFKIKESELYFDPENGKVSVKDIVQMDKKNPVTFVEKNGMLEFQAKKTGKFSIALKVQDDLGNEETVYVKGKIKNRIHEMLKKVFLIMIGLGCVMMVIWESALKRKIKKLENQLNLEYQDFSELLETSILKQKIEGSIKELKEVTTQIKNYFQESAQSTIKQVQEWNLQSYVDPDYEKENLKNLASGNKKIANFKKEADTIFEKFKHANETDDLTEYKDEVEGYVDEMRALVEQFENHEEVFNEKVSVLKKDLEIAKDKFSEAKAAIEREIPYSFEVKCQNEIGFKGKNRGSYQLGDILVSVRGTHKTLDEMLGECVNISVYGCMTNEVQLRSAELFEIRDMAMRDFEKTKEVVLSPGSKYQIKLNYSEFTITVEDKGGR